MAWGRYTPGTEPPADRGDLVLQGLDKDGNPALSSGSVGVPNPGVQLPFTVNGTAGETDTLAVVHRDRNLNVSAVVSASLVFEAFSPTWVAFDGVHFLRRALALTGFQPATKKVVFAITLKRSAAQLATTTSGGLMVANGSSDSVPTYTLGGTSKLQLIQETNANTAFANLVVPPATNMVADTEYLLLGTIYADGTNAIMKAAMFNIATGAQLGGTASTGLLADAAFTFKNNYDIFKGPATYERIMLWDNPGIAAPDATDATLRSYFISDGALLDPAVARDALGAPLIDPDLATGANRGSGGNFTMT
jgi:hypothetical protein